MTLAERFWPKVEKSDGCWMWTAAKLPRGYGLIGRGGHRGGHMLAHRAAWELTNGAIPAGVCVLHRCDNPSCVRPDHLFLGTTQDNVRDKVAKGRQRNGNTDRIVCKKGHSFAEHGYTYPNGRKRACRACLTERSRHYTATHLELCRQRARDYVAANKDLCRQKSRESMRRLHARRRAEAML